ncbi:MAG: (d)CMP kinase [Chloroflexi bacterium]|nr:(d)CMP kinase [Chloroflexota bacterium]
MAIDGPSAAGKSAVGGRVAERLGYRFIDTGMMYRAITWLAHERQVDLEDDAALTRLAESVELALEADRVRVDGIDVTDRLRSTEVGKAVSLVSRVAGVREAMVRGQRAMAGQGRVVMAGRDIGTVVLPDAPLKVYLEASAAERNRRRHEELRAMGRSVTLQQVRDELANRDAIDSERAVSPLRPAEDAVVIDTDALSLEQVVERILELAPCQS